MATYTVTERSIVYRTYTVEAENEQEVRNLYETTGLGEGYFSEYSEDTDIYDITPEGDED